MPKSVATGVLGKYTDQQTTDPLHRPNYFLKLEKYTELPKYRINTQTILIHSLTKNKWSVYEVCGLWCGVKWRRISSFETELAIFDATQN